MSKNSKTDRRVIRTVTSLQEGLKALMVQKPYAKIKVSEIVEVANVARPTFYMHFETKDALLYSLFDHIFAGFKSKLAAELGAGQFDLRDIAVNFFKYWEEHAETMRILLDAEIDLIVLDQFRQCVASSTLKMRETGNLELTPFAHYIDDCLAGSLYMVLKRWIEEGQTMPPEEMGQYFGEIALLSRGAVIA